MNQEVCVIGAGPSGITAAKNLLDAGLHVTVYDFGKEVGGNWLLQKKKVILPFLRPPILFLPKHSASTMISLCRKTIRIILVTNS